MSGPDDLEDDRERGDEPRSYPDSWEDAMRTYRREQDAFNRACWEFDEQLWRYVTERRR
jgi:hypothetical protein